MSYADNLEIARVSIDRLISFNKEREVDRLKLVSEAIASGSGFDNIALIWNSANEANGNWKSCIRISNILREDNNMNSVMRQILDTGEAPDEFAQYIIAILTAEID